MKDREVLLLKDVGKYYKNDLIFKNVNLSIKKGEVVSIVGRSGCGKSTLLKCINRLEDITEGEIELNGINTIHIDSTELRQKIGIVFQDYNLFEHLTVMENLIIGLTKIKGYPISKSKELATKMLERIDLLEKIDRYPEELSGGQKQRVSIARTLLMKPDIILIDEPTSALDSEMKESVLLLINELVKEDMTLIIVSHEDDFVKKVSDKIYKLTKNGLTLVEE